MADRRKPSYILPKVFSEALLSIVIEGSARLAEDVDAGTDRLPVDASTGFARGFVVQIHEERMEITKEEPSPPVDRERFRVVAPFPSVPRFRRSDVAERKGTL